MRTKRFLITAALMSAVVCAFFFCDNPYNKETLKWKSSMDLTFRLSAGINANLGNAAIDSGVVLDMGKQEIQISPDLKKRVTKFEDHEAELTVSVTNATGVDFTLYGLLFKNHDAAADMSIAEYYDLITNSPAAGLAASGRITLSGESGISAPPGETGTFTTDSSQSAPLCSLVLNSASFTWRWLAQLEPGSDPGDLSAGADTVNINLKIRVSGVNSFD